MPTITQTIEAHELVSRSVTLQDPELERLARTYRDSAKLRSRITFLEFCANSDAFLAVYENWQDTVWIIDFVDFGDHQKMWVNDHITGKTLRVDIIRSAKPSAVTDRIEAIVQDFGKPEKIILPETKPDSFNAIALSFWCDDNAIDKSFYRINDAAFEAVISEVA